MRRANARYTGTSGFKTLEGIEYKLARGPNRYEVAITPQAGMRFRGRVGELANQEIGRTMETAAGQAQYRAVAGQTEIGRLGINRTANGFKVGWTARDIDNGIRSPAASAPATTSAKPSHETGTCSRRPSSMTAPWSHASAGRSAGSNMPRNTPVVEARRRWQARAAGFQPQAKSVKMQWVDDAWVKSKAGERKFGELMTQSGRTRTPGDELADLMAAGDRRAAARLIARDPGTACAVRRRLSQGSG